MNIKFENGSEIQTLEPVGKITYGKRRDEAIKSMIEQLLRYPSLYVELITGKRLPWYQRFWIDMVLKYFDGGIR